MLTYVLILPDQEIVDNACSIGELDFSKVRECSQFEVGVRFEETFLGGGLLKVIAVIDLTGYLHQEDWAIAQVQNELEFRSAFPGFEDEIKMIDGPILSIGDRVKF
jgi:hypothetical protein